MTVTGTVDTTTLPVTTNFVGIRSDNDEYGFSFWLARITEPLTYATRPFEGDDGSRFKKGDPHICVQYLERTPPESPHVFTLSETEMYVHPSSVFTAELSPHERRGDITIVLSDNDINDIHERLTIFLHDDS